MSNYFFSQIFSDLKKHVSSKVKEIKHVDLDTGQLKQKKEGAIFEYPMLLIDFSSAKFSNLFMNNQLGSILITFKLVFNPSENASEEQKNLEYFGLEEKLHNSLQGWGLNYFTSFLREDVKSQRKHGLYIRKLTYATEYEDYNEDYIYKNLDKDIDFNGDLGFF